MHKKDMVDAMLGKIEQAIIRILNNSQSIDSYHYYLITPAGMGMRDIIAHHYFDLDAAVVFEVVKNNLPSMLTIIKKMRTELPLHEI